MISELSQEVNNNGSGSFTSIGPALRHNDIIKLPDLNYLIDGYLIEKGLLLL